MVEGIIGGTLPCEEKTIKRVNCLMIWQTL